MPTPMVTACVGVGVCHERLPETSPTFGYRTYATVTAAGINT
ncbi:hypothetical protein Q5692_25080 [Microcoleus sp. C2C3]